MKKLLKWLKRIDDNILHIFLVLYIVAISLMPKIPLQNVTYTYIKIRIDDIFPLVLIAVFIIQLIRKKVKLNAKFLVLFALFWTAVFASYIVGSFITKSIPIEHTRGRFFFQSLAFYHSLRRVEYMLPFFISASIIKNKKEFIFYIKLYLFVALIVCVYGLGQRFAKFPSIQSMNPAFVDGRLLTLSETDRINSTFGGHFDLAAYLTFTIPIALGAFLLSKSYRFLIMISPLIFIVFLFLLGNPAAKFLQPTEQKQLEIAILSILMAAAFIYLLVVKTYRYYAFAILMLINLLYTAARSSYLAYFFTFIAFLAFARKFKFLLIMLLATAVLTLTAGEMTKRFRQTFQFKIVFTNTLTGSKKIDQTITVKELPAGGYQIPVNSKTAKKKVKTTKQKIEEVALEEVVERARQKGEKLSELEIQKRVNEFVKYIVPQQRLLCDISCATRLQLEWPRAIAAFINYPILGKGPSSVTEATDNDFLRWLAELGIVGTGLFLAILYQLIRHGLRIYRAEKTELRYLYLGFVFGVIALLINAVYVDVFEASKVAYNFWIIAGVFMSSLKFYEKERSK